MGILEGCLVESKTSKGIKTTTLDNIINEYNIKKISLMKIDIEGGELNALKGCLNTLKKRIVKYIIIEISPCFNNDSYEILEILKINNYNIYNIPHKEVGFFNTDKTLIKKIINNKITNIKQFINSINKQTNILAIIIDNEQK